MFSRGLSRAILASAALASAAVLTGCANAHDAAPVTKDFTFGGRTLNVRAHGTPTDLVATDRKDIQVTRWFDVRSGAKAHSDWTLKGGTLDLEAGCEHFANCDVRYRIEVPKSMTVLRDGRATHLKGGGAATPAAGKKSGA